jgi:hypothetical protein
MLTRDQSFATAAIASPLTPSAARRPDVASLLAAVTTGASISREPRAARERFEEELRAALDARSVTVREEAMSLMPPPPNVMCVDIPLGPAEVRARLEAVFDAPRPMDDWICQLLDAASHVAAILLELERAGGRLAAASAKRPADGAAPLIGSSDAIKRMRDRIERVAATDFTILIEGAIGPESHPILLTFSVQLPSVTALGRWRERGTMGRRPSR